jgi:putative 4-mercaptohistidine N1-methyltranferase
MNIYETDKLRSEYLLFHFGSPEQILSWPGGPREALEFPARIVERFSSGEVERALDLGCAVGRAAFELSRAATEVVALDYSQAFVDAGREMQSAGRCKIARLEEGKRSESIVVLPPPGARPDRIVFEQGDAMALRADLGSFDRVLAANLLCRLGDPARLLARLPELVKPGGELILTTPCTWLEDFTPRDHWPPGSTLDWLKTELAPHFELLEEHDEPFLIRETARKFQWTVALLTKWRRN